MTREKVNEQKASEIHRGSQKEAFILKRLTLLAREQHETSWEFVQEKTMRTNNAYAAVNIVQKEGLSVLLLEAAFLPETPAFGYQTAFCEQEGVSLVLTPAWETSFMAVYQHKEWWLRPAFGSRFPEIPEKTQLLVFQNGEIFSCFLAVCGKQNRTDLTGCEEGIRLTLSSNQAGQTRISECALVCGCGRDPYDLIERMTAFALKLTGKMQPMRRDKPFPAIFEKIGWCTWDSLGQNVNEKAIFDKMDEFREKNIPLDWVLIDDGWSGCNREKQTLTSLEADPERFPSGLAETIRVLKEKYQVGHVGVWQAVKGYWNGIEAGSEAERRTREYIKRYPNGELSVRADAASSFGFWSTWHSGLKASGVDFVKIDEQSSFSLLLRGNENYGSLAGMHAGMEASAALYFDGAMINCMGMAPEDVWNRQNTAISRNSDDFTPTVPDSFTEHALQNSYNSVYQGCLYWGDWDMVWSMHPDAKRNILLRILSGGPFYLSDGLHRSDPAKIVPAILPDGTITRCQDVARPTLDCLTDGRVLRERSLKIYNRYEDTVYLGVFSPANPEGERTETIQMEQSDIGTEASDGIRTAYSEAGGEYTDCIRRTDFPDILPERYWIYDWNTREAQICETGKDFFIKLQPKDAALYHIIPAEAGIGVIGIMEKYISGACICDVFMEERENMIIRLKCGGTFAFLTEDTVKAVCVDGIEAPFKQKGCLVTVPVCEDHAMIQIELR